MTVANKIQASFDAQTMMKTLGARLIYVANGECEITAPLLPGSLQQNGFGHAALTFAIGDSAAGYAALSVMPEDCEVLTSEIKINLLSPAKGDLLIARGKVVKPGRRLVVVTSEVFARTGGEEKQIALMQGTMVPVQS
ncbi:PaaI family thioesterase [Thalassovita sp.]|uniref:PaaI family thioesterase n=1 Tax=Thalassovita sp. TaxID=1979401 RepID=UPI002B26BC3F|nr:PaaI family thioesterase [Thalassovita sp.]